MKVVILDYSTGEIHLVTNADEFVDLEGQVDLEAIVDHINETLDTYIRTDDIEWMSTEETKINII